MQLQAFARILSIFLLTAVYVEANPVQIEKRGNIIVGYRRADEAQAVIYNSLGTVNWDPKWAQWGSQIGKGVYSTPTRDMYKLAKDSDWYCVISVDESAFQALHKAWIPERDSNKKRLWMQTTDTNLDNYIRSLDSAWEPDTTIRLSIMPNGKSDRSAIQMCIPPGLVTSVKFQVFCKESKDDVEDQHVNYASFKNVKGTKGT